MTFRKKIATSGAVLALGCSLLSSSVLAPAAYAAPEPSATPIVKEYTDGATLTFPATWTEGEPLEFSGVNFFATDGTPSVLAVRLNGGPVGSSDYLQFEADADGKVSGSIPWQDRYTAGSTATINVLTGSLNPNDNKRGGIAASVTVVDKNGGTGKAKPSESASADANKSESPKEDPSKGAKTETPAKEESSPAAKEEETRTAASSATTEADEKPLSPISSSASPTAVTSASSNNSSGNMMPWLGYGLIGGGVVLAALVIFFNIRRKSSNIARLVLYTATLRIYSYKSPFAWNAKGDFGFVGISPQKTIKQVTL